MRDSHQPRGPLKSINLLDLQHAAAVVEYLASGPGATTELRNLAGYLIKYAALAEIHASLTDQERALLELGYAGPRGEA